MRNVRRVHVVGKGIRCQIASGKRKGKFTRCPSRSRVAGLDGDTTGAIQRIPTRRGVRCRSTITNKFVSCPTSVSRFGRTRKRRKKARRRRY